LPSSYSFQRPAQWLPSTIPQYGQLQNLAPPPPPPLLPPRYPHEQFNAPAKYDYPSHNEVRSSASAFDMLPQPPQLQRPTNNIEHNTTRPSHSHTLYSQADPNWFQHSPSGTTRQSYRKRQRSNGMDIDREEGELSEASRSTPSWPQVDPRQTKYPPHHRSQMSSRISPKQAKHMPSNQNDQSLTQMLNEQGKFNDILLAELL
jgi:hypothetical protein